MRVTYIILITFLFCQDLFAKPNLILETKTHKLEIKADTAIYGRARIYEIKVYDFSNKLIKIIIPKYPKHFNYSYGGISEYSFIFKDINEDNIEDLIFIKNYSDNYVSNNQFCFLSNAFSKSFEELIGFDTISNISNSQLPRIISETEFRVCNCNTTIEYGIKSNKLFLKLNSQNENLKQQEISEVNSTMENYSIIDSRYGILTKKFSSKYYDYIFTYDSTIMDNYSEIYLAVLDKDNHTLLNTNLRYNNIYFPKWLFSKDNFHKEFIQEIDLNSDGRQDFILTSGTWPSTIKAWIYKKKMNRFFVVNEFDDLANVKVGNDKLEYTVAIPCGTGYPPIDKHIFSIKGENFELLEIEQKLRIRISYNDLLVINRTINCNTCHPVVTKETRRKMAIKKYEKWD